MAFAQRPQAPRQQQYPPLPQASEVAAPSQQRQQGKRPLEESEEWVLFSPATESVAARTHTTSTERTPRTAGLSRLSDFGSLDTAAHSGQVDLDDNITCQGTDPDDETAELDSLDDGLHAFHEPSEYSSPARRPVERSGETLLPTHDGLGMFPSNSMAIQEQLLQFERHSPRRKTRRRSSVQRRLDALDEADELTEESERIRRIEKWRLEQSRALLEEIERETRRLRRISRTNTIRSQTASAARSEVTGLPTPVEGSIVAETESVNTQSPNTEKESFLHRFTRRVIRDLMGIDEELLSVIFGEALPSDVKPASAPATVSPIQEALKRENSDIAPILEQSWEHKLLGRIARELGILVHQLSEHPGAFSTYLRTQEVHDYAGLSSSRPIKQISDSASIADAAAETTPLSQSAPSPTGMLFEPTVQTRPTYSEASLWGIEEEFEPYDPGNRSPSVSDEDREYWERELDVKMVFNFLVKRFSSRPSSPSLDPADAAQPGLAGPSQRIPTAPLHTTTTTTHSARRAALIKQHHPLVSSARAAEHTSSHQSTHNKRRDLSHRHHVHHQHHHHHHHHHTPSAASLSVIRSRVGAGHHHRQGSSSCASQSTKKSRKSGSSRNYWDLGGSGVGSAGGGMGVGVWGEV